MSNWRYIQNGIPFGIPTTKNPSDLLLHKLCEEDIERINETPFVRIETKEGAMLVPARNFSITVNIKPTPACLIPPIKIKRLASITNKTGKKAIIKLQNKATQGNLSKPIVVPIPRRVYPFPIDKPDSSDGAVYPDYEDITDLVFHDDADRIPDGFLVGCECSGGCNSPPIVNARKSISATKRKSPSSQLNSVQCTCVASIDAEISLKYSEQGRLKKECIRRFSRRASHIVECNCLCACNPSTCANRVVQNGPKVQLRLRHSKTKGWCVLADEDIEAGSFIGQYLGEVLGRAEANRREEAAEEGSYTPFLMDLDFYCDNADYIFGAAFSIDAQYRGNITRFFNHSCDPNMIILPVSYDMGISDELYRMAFFSKTPILKGEELTFDYEGTTSRQKKKGPTSRLGFQCHCGSVKCKTFIF